jgi:hypothetical protein
MLGAFAAQSKNYNQIRMEVAAGLEPAKTGFADQRLGLFGIATPYQTVPETAPKLT